MREAETETVTEIMQPDDPVVQSLPLIEEVARRWKATPEFTIRCLRQHGVRLVRVPASLRVHLADLEQLEDVLTTHLKPLRRNIRDG